MGPWAVAAGASLWKLALVFHNYSHREHCRTVGMYGFEICGNCSQCTVTVIALLSKVMTATFVEMLLRSIILSAAMMVRDWLSRLSWVVISLLVRRILTLLMTHLWIIWGKLASVVIPHDSCSILPDFLHWLLTTFGLVYYNVYNSVIDFFARWRQFSCSSDCPACWSLYGRTFP